MKEFYKKKIYVYCDPRYSNDSKGYKYRFEGGSLKLKHKPFYIGCAGYNNHLRHLVRNGRNGSNELVHQRIEKIREENLEPIVKVLKIYKDKNKSFKLEEILIIAVGRQDLKTGPLLNKLDGYKNLSPKASRIRSKKIKRNWENPKYRKNMSEEKIKNWKNPEYRKKMSKKRKEIWENFEYRKKMSEKRKEVWKDPEYRKNMSESSRKIWEDPKYRKNISEKRKEMWKNPEHRKRMSKRMSGEKNPSSRLIEKEVLEIRRLYKEKNISQHKLAEKFKVSQSCIRHIMARHTWAHI
ncbi:MAG TPA: hypothetical protein VMZ91_11865 [Candidatus Paceibacterota bacterium]|nr:hypothetical protein [Candidatus Paceibacterota bacterium]